MEKKFKVRKMTEGDGSVAIWQVSGSIEPQDINEAVYAAMCEAGKDIIGQSVCRLSGEHTAVELAGKVAAGIPVFDIPETMAPEVRIIVGMISVGYKQQAPMFTCSFAPDDVFGTIAEWEGQMGMAPKKYHKFKCEAEEEKEFEVKPYVRHRGYRPKTISYVMYHRQLNDRFETLGLLYQSLSSLGMRRALSVIAAVKYFENMSYEWQAIAKDAMRRKLWRDYGTCGPLRRREEWLKGEMERMDKKGSRYKDMEKELADIRSRYQELSKPVPFSASDFNGGPACYQVVDDLYVRELVASFRLMMKESPKPEWPERGDVVTIKDGARTLKKHEGKHLVDSIAPRLSADGRRIEWTVAVSVGKYECEHFLPEQLEAADVQLKKKKAPKPKANAEPKAETLSLSERLRQALLARLAA